MITQRSHRRRPAIFAPIALYLAIAASSHSCATTRAASPVAREPSSRDTALTSASPSSGEHASSAGAAPESSSTLASPSPARPVVETVPASPSPQPFSPQEWATSRGVPSTDNLLNLIGTCRVVPVGSPAREALFCEANAPLYQRRGGEAVFPLIVAEVRDHQLHALLQTPLFAGAMDFEGVTYVRLAASLSADGLSITVAERPEARCAAARAHARQLMGDPSDAPALRDYLAVIDRTCRAVGTLTWRRDRFVRTTSEH